MTAVGSEGPLAGRVALVTGGSSGLGRVVALEFARRGAAVAVCSRREAEGRETVAQIEQGGGQGLFVACDVTEEEQVRRFVEAVLTRFSRLDCAVNNAGIAGVVAPLVECSADVFDEVMAVNVKGTWLCMKYEIPAMLRGGRGGNIVNISSMGGLVGVSFGAAPYSASKHAIVGLSRCAALEVGAAGIRVNALCPGGFPSDLAALRYKDERDPEKTRQEVAKQYPLRRRASVEEVARAAVWLCGDDASFITGAAIPVDGGYTAG